MAAAGTGGIVLCGGDVPGLTVATALAGLGIAPLYPLLTALGAAAAEDTTSAAGVLSAGAAAAAAIGPFLQGLLGNGHDGGMILPAALALPLVVGVVLTVRQDRSRKTTRPMAAD
ncbi:hypothetical protein [Crossiella equi]|uniref:hypothetical protein n=1 Tax=Crossiella equi TaxID=130796 RepID=UPI002011E27B|nr:hypothetical protein [Crossiella equi]